MDIVKRLVKAINFSYVLYAVAVVALLYVFTTPLVIDPLIAFVLAGIVPGTDIVLSPDTVLAGLVAASAVLAVVFVLPSLVRWYREGLLSDDEAIARAVAHGSAPAATENLSASERRRVSREIRHTSRESMKAAISAAHGEPAAISKVSRQFRRASAQAIDYPWMRVLMIAGIRFLQFAVSVISLISRTLLLAVGLVLLMIKYLLIAMIEGAVQIITLAWRGLRLAGKYGTWAFVFMIVCIGVVVDYLVRISKFAWVHARPHLEHFDSWLELRYRGIISSVRGRAKRMEVWQVSYAIGKSLLQARNESTPTATENSKSTSSE
jgi:hypothetical protein